LDSNTGSELIVALAWRSAEVAALGAAALLAIALAVRQYLRHVDRVQAGIVAAWRPLLTRIAIEEGAAPALPRLRARHVPHLMEEWNALRDAVRGDAAERLNGAALALGLDVSARRMLGTRPVGRRILAVRTLGHLRDPSSWQPLQEQLASTNSLVAFYAAAALVQIDAQRAMPGIMLQLTERWPGEAMARLLVDAGADVAREPIRSMMLSLPPGKVPRLLPWLVHVDAVLGSEVAIELLRRHPDHEELVAEALVAVLEPAVLPELERFAGSANADVRQSLAIAHGHLGGLGEIPTLARLLCDPVWWVRYRAGQALLQLKGMDAAHLEGLRAQLTDPYALDMLRHVQAEAGA
jgi:HEAT repeat protein